MASGISTEDAQCAICLEDLKSGEDIRRLSCIGRHKFHRNCIDDWLRINTTCPICRGPISPPRRSPSPPRTSERTSGREIGRRVISVEEIERLKRDELRKMTTREIELLTVTPDIFDLELELRAWREIKRIALKQSKASFRTIRSLKERGVLDRELCIPGLPCPDALKNFIVFVTKKIVEADTNIIRLEEVLGRRF